MTSEEGRKRKTKIILTPHEIQLQSGRTIEEAARNLNVSKSTFQRNLKDFNISWPRPKGLKRKVTLAPLAVNVDTFTIKAEYQNDTIKFCLPLSLITFEAVEKKIGEKLKLNVGSFKIKIGFYWYPIKTWQIVSNVQQV